MRDTAAEDIVAELARRRPAFAQSARDLISEATARLRAFYHPKQRAYLTSLHKRKATRKTRRAGATSGGCREFIARAVEHPGFRGTYVTTTRREARDRAWLNDSRSGLLDVLRQFGTPQDHPSLEVQIVGGVRCDIRDQAMTLDFENGSHIDLFGADDERALRKQRGLAKHVYWIDEAQDFRHLERFYDAVVIGSLTDFNGECWLSGTPGVDCAGMFYEITKEPGADGDPMPNWEVHEIASVDNPMFGRVVLTDSQRFVEDNIGTRVGPFDTDAEAEAAAVKVRWDRSAGAAMAQKGWKGTEPDFIREWLGKWVREDARFVYPVHAVPKHDLLYAPQRLTANPFVGTHPRFDGHPPWCDIQKAISDLPKMPKYNKRRQWMYAIGVDFGYNPDPFALAALAFSHDLEHVYELFSWKQTRVNTDDQGAYMKLLWDSLDNVIVFVGDPAGKQDDFDVWRTRMGLPIDEANKRGKNTLEEFLADDIRRGRIHLRIDSPLHTEMKHLVYLPTKPGKTREVAKHRRGSDGKVHGDHCCLIAGTRVETEHGPVTIETVEVGERVLTRSGFRVVTRAWLAGHRDLWRLVTVDGHEIVGTDDHPIWTENGWKTLADLTPGDTLTVCEPRPECSKTEITDVIRNIENDRCASTSADASSLQVPATSNICTAPSGPPLTVQSQTDIMFTTSTRTRATTISPICNSSSAPSILASTPALQNASRYPGEISTRLAISPQNGTGPQKVSRGTQSTDRTSCGGESSSRCDANAALSILNRRILAPNSARTLAKPRPAETAVLTTRIGFVPGASESSGAAGSTSQNAFARTRVLRVEPLQRKADVYNLTVDGAHEFFANGLLVSNCDCARYAYASLTHFMSKSVATVPEPGSPAAYALEAEKIEQRLDDREKQRVQQLADGDEDAYERSLYDY